MFKSKRNLIRLNMILIFFCLTSSRIVFSQPIGNLPFLAEIIENKINVRAGQSTGFEKLCQLDKGDEVVVFEQSYSWYKIRLPKRCPAYINEKYVERIDVDKGKITGSHVNIRANANAESTSLGMIAKDGEVKILGKKDGWYKIEPNELTFGWMAGQFATFKSNDISLYHEPEIEKNKQVDNAIVQNKADNSSIPSNVIDVVGMLEKTDGLQSDVHYQITLKGQIIYYLKSSQQILVRFVGSKVNIKGIQIESPVKLSAPMLELYQVRLIY